jgi:hypothetical protein
VSIKRLEILLVFGLHNLHLKGREESQDVTNACMVFLYVMNLENADQGMGMVQRLSQRRRKNQGKERKAKEA